MLTFRITHLAAIALILGGCGGKPGPPPLLSIIGVTDPYRRVQFRLTLDGKPIHAAHLRAVAIDTGSMALPISGDVVAEALFAWGDTAATDGTGLATLKLFAGTPHLIEISPPPFGDLADRGPWTWTMEADGSSLTESTSTGEPTRAPTLEIAPTDEHRTK